MTCSSSPSAKTTFFFDWRTLPMSRCSVPAMGSRRADSVWLYCSMSSMGRRATPVSIAAFATAGGMAEIRRGSNGTGMM